MELDFNEIEIANLTDIIHSTTDPNMLMDMLSETSEGMFLLEQCDYDYDDLLEWASKHS